MVKVVSLDTENALAYVSRLYLEAIHTLFTLEVNTKKHHLEKNRAGSQQKNTIYLEKNRAGSQHKKKKHHHSEKNGGIFLSLDEFFDFFPLPPKKNGKKTPRKPPDFGPKIWWKTRAVG